MVANTDDAGPGSLRQTIADANTSEHPIFFEPALSGATITLTSGRLRIDKSLTIHTSALPDGLTIDADGNSQVIQINHGHTVALHSLTLIGGIYNSGTLTLNRSTLSGNSAFLGGGIYNYFGGTVTLNQSTLSGNSASSSGGGISNGGALMLTNSIVAGNTAFSGGNIAGHFEEFGSNLTSGDPLLAPLGDYGGPTQTMPPLPGSLAINAAGSINPGSTDQRGFPRLVSSGLDIGAVEFQASADLARFWNIDMDGDGKPFGLEFAIGSDPLLADTGAAGSLTRPMFATPGEASLSFGVNPAAEDFVTWVLQRSPDLSPGSFEEIYHFASPLRYFAGKSVLRSAIFDPKL
ncbi:MAG: hypothetical protein EA353_11555 [Puniceicoccaceae bacterium]|nr:MAG: hypothetical protein EA353_11555 [Puniceicoccaceae bacterium]